MANSRGGRSGMHGLSRRVVLGTAATFGLLLPGPSTALAAQTGERRPTWPAGQEGPADGPASPPPDGTSPATATPYARAGEVWGTSSSGRGTGVRGNGRSGVVGEGTHSGVTGDGFVGVRGSTSIVQDDQRGVGVWAEAVSPGSTALRADGPSEFNGTTRFSRSGVVSIRRGSSSHVVTGVSLTADTAILATLQNFVNGLQLQAVEADATAGSFTIFLSSTAARDVKIGWFALG
jgi:hypothetical protein